VTLGARRARAGGGGAGKWKVKLSGHWYKSSHQGQKQSSHKRCHCRCWKEQQAQPISFQRDKETTSSAKLPDMAPWGDTKLFFCILFITCCCCTGKVSSQRPYRDMSMPEENRMYLNNSTWIRDSGLEKGEGKTEYGKFFCLFLQIKNKNKEYKNCLRKVLQYVLHG